MVGGNLLSIEVPFSCALEGVQYARQPVAQ